MMFRKSISLMLIPCVLLLQTLTIIPTSASVAEAASSVISDVGEATNLFSAGNGFSVIAAQDGSVKSWGTNASGQLGLGDTMPRTEPTTIPSLSAANVTQIAANLSSHVLLLQKDGTVLAWGNNDAGQLGLGDTANRLTPILIPNLTDVIQVAVGTGFSMALLKDGTVKAWGTNTYGQLGLSDTVNRSVPTIITGLNNIIQVAAGGSHSLALLKDGTVKSWGRNNYGQLGMKNSNTDLSKPSTIEELTGVKFIAAGSNHSLALKTDSTVSAWGYNITYTCCGNTSTKYHVTYPYPKLSAVKQIAAGDTTSLALMLDGTVQSFGGNSPVAIAGISDVSSIVMGSLHSFAVFKDGSIKGWGNNTNYELGTSDNTARPNPTITARNLFIYGSFAMDYLNTSNNIISTGTNHSLMMSPDGALVSAWGLNSSGELGLGDNVNRSIPTIVPGLSGAQQVYAKGSHTLAVMKDGTVRAWGLNSSGQLGLKDLVARNVPTEIPDLTNVKEVGGGTTFSLALLHDGTVKAWGNNGSGQLGLGDTTNRNIPTLIPGLTGVSSIIAGDNHVIALLTDGSVKVWGLNSSGQLGLNDTTIRKAPTTLTNIKGGISKAAAASNSSFLLMNDETVYAWGSNSNGELGLGNTIIKTVPTLVSGLTQVSDISAGGFSVFAILTNGTVKGWGNNALGQLGLGDTITRTSPVMTDLNNIEKIYAGTSTMFAKLKDGRIRGWGNNNYSNLGNNSTASSSQPIFLPFLSPSYITGATIVPTLVAKGAPLNSSVLVKYFVDSEKTPRQTITQMINQVRQTIGFAPLDLSKFSNGSHTIRYEISSGVYRSTEYGAFLLNAPPQVNNTSVLTTDTEVKFTNIQSVERDPNELTSSNQYTVGDNASGWIQSLKSVNSTITTASGLANIARLSNGWFVTSLYSSTNKIVFNISKDSGATWVQLTSLNGTGYTSNAYITSKGTKVIGVIATNSGASLDSFTFDALEQTDADIVISPNAIDTNQTNISNIKIVTDNSGIFHVVWTAGSSSSLLRYSKSDDGALWLPVTQVAAGSSSYSPAIATTSSGVPIITVKVATTNSNPTYYSMLSYVMGPAGWTAASTIVPSSTSFFYFSDIVIDEDNVIHVVWSATDSVDTSAYNIRYSKSTDGLKWETPTKLTSGNTSSYGSPVISSDRSGNLSVWFNLGNNMKQLIRTKDGWGQIKNLTSVTNTSSAQYSKVENNNRDFLILYRDSSNSQLKLLGTVNSSDEDYTVSSLTPNTKYPIKFESKDGNGQTASWEKEVYTKAQKPVVSAEQITETTANIVVQDNNPEGTQYQFMSGGLYISSDSTLGTSPDWITLQSKSMKVSGLTSGASYAFQVKARNDIGEETESVLTGSFTTLTTKLSIPAGIRTSATENQIALSWEPVQGATAYQVQIDEQTDSIQVDSAVLSYVHANLSASENHSYRVRAVRNDQVSEWSDKVDGQTLETFVSTSPELIVTASSTATLVAWAPVADALAYELEVNGEVKRLGVVTSYEHNKLIPGTRHTYRIRSITASGTSSWGPVKDILTSMTAPDFNTAIRTSTTNSKITLSWDTVLDAQGYEVESDGTVTDNGASTFVEVSGLEPTSTHTFRVRSTNAAGASGWSGLLTISTNLLDTPVNLVSEEDVNSVKVDWDAVTDASGYEIMIDEELLDAGNHTTYTKSGLTPETMHTFKIRAKNQKGFSGWSEPLSVSTLPVKPGMPTKVDAIAGKDIVTITWDAVGDADAYEVELDGLVVVESYEGTQYTDILLDPVSTHTYRVRAKNVAIEGDWSPVITVTTLPGTPEWPKGIHITSSGSVVNVAWAAEPGATGYNIEVDGTSIDVGTKTQYQHRRLIPGKEYQYRLQTRNKIGISDWSGLIKNNTISARLSKGKTVDLGLTAADVVDFSQYLLTVTYDPNAVDVVDLSRLTAQKELTTGKIEGTDIRIVEFTPGKITFVSDKAVTVGESWTGVINSIQFKAKVSGGSPITYTVITKKEEVN
ncbi:MULTISPECIES: RCC1 domain-containing protein [Paenibacillus]|uniref:RCC1 domain-containing protein n=1 Tax=Paenibacillus TaxID=44249 RepID=UPI0022B89602|nr:hypothetical protein [Paenibacillus caseinilyticus]MCZ8518601.1 hypothetical protein [Paenibacillus caseinilyticus]